MDQGAALDTSLAQDVVSALLVAVASVLTAARLAAGDAQSQQAAALAGAVGPGIVPVACLLQVGLKAPGAVKLVEPAQGLLLARLRQAAAVPVQQMGWLAAQQVSALVERAFPGWEALRGLAAWACQH